MKKASFCVRIFDISPCVFTQLMSRRAHWMCNLILYPTSTHIAYFQQILLPQKQEIPEKMWWWCCHHIFLGISWFLGSGVHQKYPVWVLIGCGIKFHMKWALPLIFWVKTQGDMSKIRTQKVVFFLLSSKINKNYFIVLLFYYFP